MFYNIVYTRYCFIWNKDCIMFVLVYTVCVACVCNVNLSCQFIPWALCDTLPRSMSAVINIIGPIYTTLNFWYGS